MMKEGPDDAAAFEDGVHRSAQPGGVLHHLFGVRARGLFGELPDTASASYLSGILIGHEVRAALRDGGRVHLLGAPQLCNLYRLALASVGAQANVLDTDAAARGLHRLAAMLAA
jgi:2-dehydro-3-deoxygalactonokinase